MRYMLMVAMLSCLCVSAADKPAPAAKPDVPGGLTNEELALYNDIYPKFAKTIKMHNVDPTLREQCYYYWELFNKRADQWTDDSYKDVINQMADADAEAGQASMSDRLVKILPTFIGGAKDEQQFITRWNNVVTVLTKRTKDLHLSTGGTSSVDRYCQFSLEEFFDKNADKYKDDKAKLDFVTKVIATKPMSPISFLKYKDNLAGDTKTAKAKTKR